MGEVFDVSEDTEALALVVLIHLPEALTGDDVEVKVTEKQIKAKCTSGKKEFDVERELPKAVDGEQAVVVYQDKKHQLRVTVPLKAGEITVSESSEDGSVGPGSPSAGTVTPEDEAKAEALKEEGNKFFKAKQWQLAIDKYTEAIDINPLPAYRCNRAFANLKLDNAGTALQDANASIKRDPSFVKAYYRKATAHEMLGKLEEALKDYKRVITIKPKDPDAMKKYKECEKEVKRIRFERAIRSPDDPVLCDVYAIGGPKDWSKMSVPASYSGPKYDPKGITIDFVKSLIEWFKSEKMLPQSHVRGMLVAARSTFLSFNNVVSVPVEKGSCINVCGDIHGQFYDLAHIFELAGTPSPTNMFLFNGDFVDRGSYGVESFLTLLSWKLLYPKHFFMSRGNHEGKTLQRIYGFEGELNAKLSGGGELFDMFQEVFNSIPLAHVIGGKVYVVHGGLFSKHGVKIEELQKPSRDKELPDTGLMHEMLWSDPHPQRHPDWAQSKRGAGVSFGPGVTEKFLEDNGLDYMIRSHEVKDEGYEVEHGGKLITVFSAPNYCDTIGNKAAYITLRPEEGFKPKYKQFEAQKHPGKKAMQYSRLLCG